MLSSTNKNGAPLMSGEREQVAQVLENSTLPYNNLQQTIALGLLALSKHDRADDQFGEAYTDAQLASVDRFTSAELDRIREQAGIMLAQFSSYLSFPVQTKSWKDWGPPIVQGFLSALAYSLFLILAALLTSRLAGHDLIDLLRDNFARPPGKG